MSENDQTYSKGISKTKMLILIIFIILVLIISFLWWNNYRKYVTTDDASLRIDRVSVSTLAAGQIKKIYFNEGDSIKKGDLLFSLNDTSARVKYNISKKIFDLVSSKADTASKDYLSALLNYKEAGLILSAYNIHSPLKGVIAKNWALAGDIVQVGQTIVSINEYKPIWVSAYIEETKIGSLFIGQKAEIIVDAYKSLKISGTIYYIANNTASEFALVSTNNASGNFTKTSQRIQIKVSIDNIENNDNIDFKLLSGMSASLKIAKKTK
ncbi:MAG: efflux RND transporter periplasmic adaptor subunit [Bacteroidales bacterium]|nr:efflux RND transporter periplasmic adaptor subunit [Bacteroidales bacterium]